MCICDDKGEGIKVSADYQGLATLENSGGSKCNRKVKSEMVLWGN